MSRVLLAGLLGVTLAGCAPPPAPEGRALGVAARFGGQATARGVAVPLAGGLVLTAAHVVDEASLREEYCRLGRWPAEPVPYLAGLWLQPPEGPPVPATRLRLGQATFTPAGPCDLAYRRGRDLALLRPAAPLPGASPAEVCAADPAPGQAVWVATRAGRVVARLAGEAAEREAANGRYALLARRLEPGDSGAGAFDAGSGCLLGIVSMRDPAAPERSWLVRAAEIRSFLAEE